MGDGMNMLHLVENALEQGGALERGPLSETCSTTTAYVGGWVVERSGIETENGEFSGGANLDPIPPSKNSARSALGRRVERKKHQTQFSRARTQYVL